MPGVTISNLRAHLTTAAGAIQPVAYRTSEPKEIAVQGQEVNVTIRAIDQKGTGLRAGVYAVHLTFEDHCAGGYGPMLADVPEGNLTVS